MSVHYRPGYKCENQFTIYKMNTKASFQAHRRSRLEPQARQASAA